MNELLKWLGSKTKRIGKLIWYFLPIWLLFFFVLISVKLGYYNGIGYFLIAFVIAFLVIPQNVLHGLIGARGSIRVFFCLFIVWTLIFSRIYYLGFFKDAVISESENKVSLQFQYQIPQLKVNQWDTIYIEGFCDSLGRKPFFVKKNDKPETTITEVTYCLVLRNTFMVSLTQQPSDFFNMAISQYGAEKEARVDLLEWLLIVQIFISWILFGVFISILYNKFRRES